MCIPPPPPLRKHRENQENDGHTGSWCLDKAVLPRNKRYQKNDSQATGNNISHG